MKKSFRFTDAVPSSFLFCKAHQVLQAALTKQSADVAHAIDRRVASELEYGFSSKLSNFS
jgi:hypothetical protein